MTLGNHISRLPPESSQCLLFGSLMDTDPILKVKTPFTQHHMSRGEAVACCFTVAGLCLHAPGATFSEGGH